MNKLKNRGKNRGKNSDLVMTEAELPPGIDAPSPPEEQQRLAAGERPSAEVEREIRSLADRVGGFSRLRALVDELAHSRP